MGEPKKSETVIQDCIKAHTLGVLILSTHAQEQMKVRDIDLSDIEEALYQAQREDNKDQLTDDKEWKYAVRGKNDNGDKDIRIIVKYLPSPKMLVITAIDKNK